MFLIGLGFAIAGSVFNVSLPGDVNPDSTTVAGALVGIIGGILLTIMFVTRESKEDTKTH